MQEQIKTKKGLSERDGSQVLQAAANDANGTLGVDGFLAGKVGRKVVLSISTTTVANDTETYVFSENGISLISYEIIYTDGNRTLMISAERIA